MEIALYAVLPGVWTDALSLLLPPDLALRAGVNVADCGVLDGSAPPRREEIVVVRDDDLLELCELPKSMLRCFGPFLLLCTGERLGGGGQAMEYACGA